MMMTMMMRHVKKGSMFHFSFSFFFSFLWSLMLGEPLTLRGTERRFCIGITRVVKKVGVGKCENDRGDGRQILDLFFFLKGGVSCEGEKGLFVFLFS